MHLHTCHGKTLTVTCAALGGKSDEDRLQSESDSCSSDEQESIWCNISRTYCSERDEGGCLDTMATTAYILQRCISRDVQGNTHNLHIAPGISAN
jgi:hypothetical protein